MKKMLLIADDFTGANDSGIKIVQRGYDASISLNCNEKFDSNINIIDTETRNLNKNKAYDIVDKTISNLENLSDYLVIYKKVDSTLRGNIRSEYEAIYKYLNPQFVIFAPAHPNLGRTTKDGIQYVNGKRILDTEFSQDPEKPVTNDNIKNILADKMHHHYIDEIRKDLNIKPGINTFDCEIYDDLLKIAQKSLEIDQRVLFIGSAGLCDALFDELIIKKPAVGIVGSVSSQNKESIEYCKKMGVPVIKITLMDYVNNSYKNKIDQVICLLKENKDVIIVTSKDRRDYTETLEYLRENNLKTDLILSKLLKSISISIINEVDISGVFTSGGTTSIEFLKSIGATGTNLINEIENGVIMNKIKGVSNDLYLVTKAGAFGNKKTIYNSLNQIRRISK
ncbi:MAG: four-carbon acid sugar kinase family protein [Anaerococcus vaginalis]|uniref:four-carbon acid sugar kinase family protein n=1 Tax=Anaerococcus vaginalis TaxID=33037 RepID=UPI00290EDBB6|nr:four-carbon acid sugar kinase family protein [Anaerococcus vaginalis]MDU5085737.1 four-carbon acid sugar kinase family protein [Anaerococcus vaginalis]